jgi:hypothetical protein
VKIIEELISKECPQFKVELDKYRLLLKKLKVRYKYLQDQHQKDGKKAKINVSMIDKEYMKVIKSTIDDISLMSLRYRVYNDCKEFNGIDKHKLFGAFIYHFTKINPTDSSLNMAIQSMFLLLSMVEDNDYSFDRLANPTIKKEFAYFLQHRHTSSENIYMFLKALSQ